MILQFACAIDMETPAIPVSSSLSGAPMSGSKNSTWLPSLMFLLFFTIFFVYQLHSFNMATKKLSDKHVRQGTEVIGVGELAGPEDLAYDFKYKRMYTGCSDGWIKLILLNKSAADVVIKDWVNTGGRPLGLALNQNKTLFVADAYKGLLRINRTGSVKLLTDQAEGVKFKLTDGVAVAEDRMVYFTDASYKYDLAWFVMDIVEGNPNGRFMVYNPKIRRTKVLVPQLYFPNGVTLSADKNSVIFCETPMRRCWRYYIRGPSTGQLRIFIENLPGLPDNIIYDGKDHYMIALSTVVTSSWNLAFKYPFIRKGLAILEKYIKGPNMDNGGVLVVDLKGIPITHYSNPSLALISSVIRIGNYLYCGSLAYPFILRLNLSQDPAGAAAA